MHPCGFLRRISRIHYIKMSLPRDLAAALRDARKKGVGRDFHERYMATIEKSWDRDQSLYQVQALAFIGLGYLLTERSGAAAP